VEKHVNPLLGTGNYSATLNNMKLVHWLYSEDGTGWDHSLPRPLLAVPNVTAHPSMASVPITVSLYCIVVCCSAVLMSPFKG